MHSQSEQRHPKRGAKRLVLFRAVGLCPPPELSHQRTGSVAVSQVGREPAEDPGLSLRD